MCTTVFVPGMHGPMNSPKPAATLIIMSLVIGIGGGVLFAIGLNQSASSYYGNDGATASIFGAILLVGSLVLLATGVYRIISAFDGYMAWKWETEMKPKPAVRPTIKTD